MRSSSPRARALQPHLRRHIQIQRQVRAKITQYRITQRSQHRLVDTATAALIGLGRQVVAIADDPLTASQSRFDHRLDQLNAGGVKHQHFGFVINHFIAGGLDIQHQAAQLLGQNSAARLAGKHQIADT